MRKILCLALASICLATSTLSYAAPPDPKHEISLKVKDIYTAQVGVVELTGKNDGPQVERYLKSVGLTKGYPWCAAFVKWVYIQAGVKTPITGAASSCYRHERVVYYKGHLVKEPEPGDAVTFYYTSLGRIAHTGFYDRRISSITYRSVEGNTSGGTGIEREGGGVFVKYRSFKATYAICRWI